MRIARRISLGAALLVALAPATALAQADSATMGADIVLIDDLATRLELSNDVRVQITPHVTALNEQLRRLADLAEQWATAPEAERPAIDTKMQAVYTELTTHKRAVKEALTEEQRKTFGEYVNERAKAAGIELEKFKAKDEKKQKPYSR